MSKTRRKPRKDRPSRTRRTRTTRTPRTCRVRSSALRARLRAAGGVGRAACGDPGSGLAFNVLEHGVDLPPVPRWVGHPDLVLAGVATRRVALVERDQPFFSEPRR